MTEERRHFSHSQLKSALGDAGCLRAWGYRYIEGITTPVAGRMHVGTAWDSLTRLVMDNKIGSIDTSVEEAQELITRRFDNPPTESKHGVTLEYDFSDIDQDATRDRLASAAELYVTDVAPTINPISVQREVRVELLGDIDLLGYVDMVERADDGSIVVTDNKASMAGRSSYTPEKATVDQQLALYQAAIAIEDGLSPLTRGWRTLDIGYKKTIAKFSNVFVREPSHEAAIARNKETMKSAADQATILLAVEAAGVFPPTGRGTWKCSERWCGYYDVCDYGRRSRTAVAVDTPIPEED